MGSAGGHPEKGENEQKETRRNDGFAVLNSISHGEASRKAGASVSTEGMHSLLNEKLTAVELARTLAAFA
jgi:hypothetical protein